MRTWRILAQVITCDFCCFSQRALHGVHSPCSHRSVMRWGGHMRCPCGYCLCLAGRVSFSTRAPVQSLTTANQRRTQTRILSSNKGLMYKSNVLIYILTIVHSLSTIVDDLLIDSLSDSRSINSCKSSSVNKFDLIVSTMSFTATVSAVWIS